MVLFAEGCYSLRHWLEVKTWYFGRKARDEWNERRKTRDETGQITFLGEKPDQRNTEQDGVAETKGSVEVDEQDIV